MRHRETRRAGAFPHVAERNRPRTARGASAWYRTAAALRAALLASLLAACAQGTPGPGQNQPPVASFSASPLQGTAPLVVAFDGSSSSDADGSIIAHAWLFGDGGNAAGASAQHTYGTPGVYVALLTVTDDRGATASAQRTITVTSADGNVPPTASFTATPSEGAAPLVVTFDATASTDPDGSVTLYAWDFGNGSTNTGATTTHTYAAPGSFEARLTVTDDAGATASASRTIVVTGDPVVGGERLQALDTAHQAGELALHLHGIRIVEAIDFVARAQGSLSGTLTEASPGVLTYTAQPSDRLRVEFLNGHTWQATFHAPPVGNTASGNAFFGEPHTIDVTVVTNAAAGALDLRITSSSTAGTQTGRVVGGFDDAAGHRWTVDVTHEDFWKAGTVGQGVESERRLFAQGVMASPSRGISVNLSRQYVYEKANFAENIDHRFDLQIAWGGASYRLQGRANINLFDSKPNDENAWIVSGSLTENGATIGQFTSSEDAQGLTVWLQMGADRFKMLLFVYSRN